MESFRRVNPFSAIFAFAASSTFSFVAQIGHRLSKVPSSSLSEMVSRLNASVKSPEISSLMAIPRALPEVSP